MSDTKTPGDKTLTVSPPKTLTLKRPVEQSTVRQSFSHGRSKQVVVEVKRRVAGPEVKEQPARSRARAARSSRQPRARHRPPDAALQALPPACCCARSPRTRRTRVSAPCPTREAREAEARRIAEDEARQRAARRWSASGRSAKPPLPASARKKSAAARKKTASAAPKAPRASAWTSRRPRARRSRRASSRLPRSSPAAVAAAGAGLPPMRQTPRPAPSGPRRVRAAHPDARCRRPSAAPRLAASPARHAASAAARRCDGCRPNRPIIRPTRQAPSAAAPRSRPDDGEARPAFRRPGGAPGGPPRGAPVPAPEDSQGRREAARPPDAVDRHRRRRRADAFGRGLPPPRPAHDRAPRLGRRQGARDARGDRPRDDHHPGTRQPHDRARRRRHPPADEAGRDAQDHRRDRRRHRPARRRGNGPHRQARRRIRRRGRPVRHARHRRRR